MGCIREFFLTFYKECLDHASDPTATPLVHLYPG